jgi:hypothetical protein
MTLQFKFYYTTPHDYIAVYLARFPFMPKLKNVLPTIIEFALIQPQACQFTAEEIFFGAVMSLFTTQQIILTDFQREIFYRLTDCWDNASIMSNLITKGINKYGCQHKNN